MEIFITYILANSVKKVPDASSDDLSQQIGICCMPRQPDKHGTRPF